MARGLVAGERAALARALSLAERDTASASRLLALLAGNLGHAHVLGITGPPGAGKSTLVGALVRQLIDKGQRVAVLAVDPSSPVSGGALLGDRFRIGESSADDRSFIRSTAARGSLGGLTRAAGQMVKMMDAAGFDLVLVETVGTGQSEVDVANLADATLVVFPPGLGDELQAIKAGVLELADFLVVTKADTDAAQRACQVLQAVAPLWTRTPPIHRVSALRGEGIGELAEAILVGARNRLAGAQGLHRRELQARAPLKEIFEELWSEMGNRLPAELADGLSVRYVTAGQDSRSLGLEMSGSGAPADRVFQLGAVTGALNALASEKHVICKVNTMDLAEGRLHLVLDYSE